MTTDPYMDPLDERLRTAMKALDDQVSDRYFEELPNRTLARLEDVMQSDTSSNSSGTASGPTTTTLRAGEATGPRTGAGSTPAPTAPAREEDSGLHDIRALAQTTKQRMSQRKIPTMNPPIDDTVLSTSSASLRAVALPDPDKMVALEAPIMGTGTGASPAIKADRISARDLQRQAVAATTMTPATARATASPITPMKAKSKTPALVIGTVLAAAAAGVVGFMALKNNKDGGAASAGSATGARPSAAGPTVEPITIRAEEAAAPAPAAAQLGTPEQAPIGAAAGGAASGSGAETAAAISPDDASAANAAKRDKDRSRDKRDDKADVKSGGDKVDPKADGKKPGGDLKAAPTTAPVKGPADKQDQSLDDLLRGAGVDPDADKKKDAPKLEKKALDAGDIRKSMSALNGKAQGCYAKFGVSGSVAVKLTVAASGEVKTAKVTGSFAGTPTGDCVSSVASGAKFPAWDGSPSTVNYSYFLSE